jgi:hypothetical protein
MDCNFAELVFPFGIGEGEDFARSDVDHVPDRQAVRAGEQNVVSIPADQADANRGRKTSL